jgi:hypothetical protein
VQNVGVEAERLQQGRVHGADCVSPDDPANANGTLTTRAGLAAATGSNFGLGVRYWRTGHCEVPWPGSWKLPIPCRRRGSGTADGWRACGPRRGGSEFRNITFTGERAAAAIADGHATSAPWIALIPAITTALIVALAIAGSRPRLAEYR